MTLGKERQAMYRRRVEEGFPDRIALVDSTALGAALEEMLAVAFGGDQDKLRQVTDALGAATVASFLKGASGRTGIKPRYGMNPGIGAAFYEEEGATGPNVAHFKVLQEGKGLGFINIADSDLGVTVAGNMARVFPDDLHCVIVKHEIPSALKRGRNPSQVYEDAWKADSLSSFGGVNVFTYEVNEEMGAQLALGPRNVEVVIAPSYTERSLEKLAGRKDIRVVQLPPFTEPSVDCGWDLKRLKGGLLIQNQAVPRTISPEYLDVVSKKQPSESQLWAAIFQWQIAFYTRSNAVVFGTADCSYGIGSGQTSRIDAAHVAAMKSKRGYGSQGTMMASDAFMPFPDVVELAKSIGCEGIVYPLGSNKDDPIVARADELDLVLLATRKPGETDSERGFYHR